MMAVDDRAEAVEGLVLHAHDAVRSLASGSSRSGTSFSQPRPTTMTSPPKFGLRAMFCSVRIGMTAPAR